MTECWIKFLESINGIGHETAKSIVDKYPTMSQLVAKYNKKTVSQGQKLLMDIDVSCLAKKKKKKKKEKN